MFFNEAYNKLNNLFGRGWPNQMIKIISKNSNGLSSLEQATASEQSRSFEDGWQNNCRAKLVSLQEAILQDTDSLQKQFVQNHPLCYRPAHLDDKDALQKKIVYKTIFFAPGQPDRTIQILCQNITDNKPSSVQKASQIWILCKNIALPLGSQPANPDFV